MVSVVQLNSQSYVENHTDSNFSVNIPLLLSCFVIHSSLYLFVICFALYARKLNVLKSKVKLIYLSDKRRVCLNYLTREGVADILEFKFVIQARFSLLLQTRKNRSDARRTRKRRKRRSRSSFFCISRRRTGRQGCC